MDEQCLMNFDEMGLIHKTCQMCSSQFQRGLIMFYSVDFTCQWGLKTLPVSKY